MIAVDAHAHVIVPELLADADLSEPWRPRVTRDPDGPQGPVVELDGRRITSMVDEMVDLDEILATLERRGTPGALLSPWVPLLFSDIDGERALERCRLQNRGLARMRRARPDRVWVLGAVPLQAPETAAAELVTLMDGGDFAGVEVTASVDGTYLGDPRFEPFWAAADSCHALVFIHPTTRGFSTPVLQERYLFNLVGNPMETTLAAAHLVLSGTMTRHRGLRVLLAHGGGAIMALSGRLRHGQSSIAAAGPAPENPGDAADAVIRRFLFDTVVHDSRLLRALIDAVGAERVLLGSDYPFDMADSRAIANLQAAGLEEPERTAVLGANAARELTTPSATRVGQDD